MKKFAIALAATASLMTSNLAIAESDVNTAAGPNSTATARLDFTIVIPRVLFLQVGTGTALTDIATVDSLTFTVPAGALGNATSVPGIGGNLGAGAVTVRVFGNNGNILLSSGTNGSLNNGAGDTIPWSEISVVATVPAAPAPGFLGVAIPHPAFPTTVVGPSTGTPISIAASNKVVRQESIWTFAYNNNIPYAPGTYGGTGPTSTQNGRVVYTATLP